jgi:2-methylcitrate dehydratase PrpD
MPSLDLQLARHASSLTYAALTPKAIERAKVFLLDTLGVGIAGGSTPEIQPLLKAVRSWGEGDEVPVWGTELKLPRGQAVLVNAYQIHCQEYDSLHEGAVLHAMATLLPVLLAEAQVRGGVTGKQLLTALAAGVDIACTLGLASNLGLRFFRPATSGGFGAVAGLANLRGFDADTTLAAFGHQLAQVSGTMQAHTEGSVVLPLQIGLNARAAMQSCDLAQEGFPSLQTPLTGKFGYLTMFETDWDLERALAGLGQQSKIAELSHKPYPSGRATHGGIEGVTVLREQAKFSMDDVAEILVLGPPLINHLVNRPPLQHPTPNYARLCMPFVLAKVLQHGVLDAMHFRGEALTDAQTYTLACKVTMQVDDNPNPNALGPQLVRVRLTDGRVLEHHIDAMLASPARPLSAQACTTKFDRCWQLAAQPMGLAAPLKEAVADLENCTEIKDLVSLLVAP